MNRTIYATDGEFYLSPITKGDREAYVAFKRHINGEDTLFLNPFCKDMMWEQVLTGRDRVFILFDKEDTFCGVLELQRADSEIPELGIDLYEHKRNMGIGPRAIRMLARTAYEEKQVPYYLVRISSKNPHSRHVFEKMGAMLMDSTKGSYESFMESLKAYIGDADLELMEEGLKKHFKEEDGAEKEIVYEYKLTPDAFL